jgi:hypothetical protein
MKVIVTKQVKYRSRIYKPGEEFEAEPKDAKMLSRVTRLADANDPKVEPSRRAQYKPPPAPEPQSEFHTEPRRTYRRRDMRSED